MNNFTAIVLAAGKGERMKSPLPKVLHLLRGKPLVWHVLKELVSIKQIKQIITVVGHKGKLVEKEVRKTFRRVEFVFQKQALGTANAVEQAKNKIKNNNVLIICADTPLITAKTLSSFIYSYIKSKTPCSLISAYMDSNNDLGKIVRDTDGKTMAIREKIDLDKLDKGEGSFPMQNGFAEVNSGIYAFDRNALFNNLIKIKKNKNKKEYFLTDIIEILYNEGHKVSPYVLNDNEEIFGINTRRDLYIAEGMLRKRIVESYIDRGVKIIDPQSTFIEDGVKIGKNTTIYPFTFIEKNVIIGNNCSLGPFLHLREGSRVLSSTHLGNFVEVCRSKLGREVTMKHFCYLGDTVVKDNVNIGAGTVVANFDGRKKNKTVIEKDAFIGSDTILVAPVKVGKGAKTGAGSVVTRNVKPKTVVVGVPAKELRKIKK